jgi:cytidylate kinase
MLEKLVITIDGPAGAGKSTAGKALAARLSYTYLDTGALYRAFAYQAKKEGISLYDDEGLLAMGQRVNIHLQNKHDKLAVFVDGEEVTDYIRTEEISLLASTVSTRPCVRQVLLALQREAAKDGGIVAEGRDMGTVVFPDADCKFFLDASIAERAKRRFLELEAKSGCCDYEQVEKDLLARDRQDRERSIAPLRPAPDAIIIDSTGMTIGEVADKITEFVNLQISKIDGEVPQS